MKKQQEWWLTMVLVVSVIAVGGMLVTGCELFKPTPPEPPPPPPNGEENGDGEEQQQSEYLDISGEWDATLKTGGVKIMEIKMTIIQDEDDLDGSWLAGPLGGELDGELEKDGDVELKLKWNPGAEVTVFVFEGEVEDDADEMDGKFEEKIGTMRTGKWEAEKD
ncbi:MAG: hypothetical protein HQ559_14150 [Lentisphaerae bacterium]|nr:hypothetical protein [Lentisphaerota bacterium]